MLVAIAHLAADETDFAKPGPKDPPSTLTNHMSGVRARTRARGSRKTRQQVETAAALGLVLQQGFLQRLTLDHIVGVDMGAEGNWKSERGVRGGKRGDGVPRDGGRDVWSG